MLTDFVVAKSEDVDKITSYTPDSEFAVVYAKNTDPVKLATLEHLLTGVTFERCINNTRLIKGPPDTEEIAICLVSYALVGALASLAPAQIGPYANEWANTEEWRMDRGTSEDLTSLLQELADLARTVDESKNMYLRICP